MNRYSYGPWNGQSAEQGVPLQDVFDKFAEKLLSTSDASLALKKMLQEGLSSGSQSERIKGLNDLLRDLEKECEKYTRKFNLDSALQDLRTSLENILQKESQAVDDHYRKQMTEELLKTGRLHEQERRTRKDFLASLPQRASLAVERLREYDFLSEEAQREFDELLQNLETIQKLEAFKRRHGWQFYGESSLTLEEATRLIAQFERITKLKDALREGNLDEVDMVSLVDFLGTESAETFSALTSILSTLEQSGYVYRDAQQLKLTPQGIRKIGERALTSIYTSLRKERLGRHRMERKGQGDLNFQETEKHSFGSPFYMNFSETFKNAIRRSGPSLPVQLSPEDMMVYQLEETVMCSTALLVDMSWSMSQEEKFTAAKKVCLALHSLIKQKFSKDKLFIVGFHTYAEELMYQNLPTLEINYSDPFTNIQDGLRLAREKLHKKGGPNKQIILVTDGQPTAYYTGSDLHIEWPIFGISPNALQYTLDEVRRCTQKGITISVFMLDESQELVSFVEKIIHLNRGRAFFTSPDNLGRYVLLDYLQGKRAYVG